MYDVVAMGEILIDFSPAGTAQGGCPLFQQSPGGAPANMACACGKFGLKTAFIGKVGADSFGRFLKDTLISNGVDVSGLLLTDQFHTTLAFVHLSADGDRSFSFYRDQTADVTLCSKEINKNLFKNCRLFHFGSLSMTTQPCRDATMTALSYARQSGCLISYDPNLREPLWADLSQAKQTMLSVMEDTDILKISQEELVFLTGIDHLEKGAHYLSHKYHIPLVLITLGAQGSYAYFNGFSLRLPALPVRAVDTTGAGDSFIGGFHYMLLTKTKGKLAYLTPEILKECLIFANATGSLTTTKKGGISALPSLSEVQNAIK
ncbi:carbohydrate kinase family protein [Youxingia wuxianensis]|uniref:Carbohydrate kinase n=1 Tax=Youxingia wuxianensis TaxID=2763678 RepID=A0A926IH33_9FIRM|nr:carbohydrate kinase [Youxingia wuxianensis]MBC8585494.1 carbohydrate kinase [Youxingia wuxianensis]